MARSYLRDLPEVAQIIAALFALRCGKGKTNVLKMSDKTLRTLSGWGTRRSDRRFLLLQDALAEFSLIAFDADGCGHYLIIRASIGDSAKSLGLNDLPPRTLASVLSDSKFRMKHIKAAKLEFEEMEDGDPEDADNDEALDDVEAEPPIR